MICSKRCYVQRIGLKKFPKCFQFSLDFVFRETWSVKFPVFGFFSVICQYGLRRQKSRKYLLVKPFWEPDDKNTPTHTQETLLLLRIFLSLLYPSQLTVLSKFVYPSSYFMNWELFSLSHQIFALSLQKWVSFSLS